MGLAERERAARPHVNKGPLCDPQRVAQGLDQPDADALFRLIFERLDLTSAQVERLLVDEGIEISQTTIARHRRGGCRKCRKG